MDIRHVHPLHKYVLIEVLRSSMEQDAYPSLFFPDSADDSLSDKGVVLAVGREVKAVARHDIVIFSINDSIPLDGAELEPEGTYLMLKEKDIHCILGNNDHEQEAPKEERADFGLGPIIHR